MHSVLCIMLVNTNTYIYMCVCRQRKSEMAKKLASYSTRVPPSGYSNLVTGFYNVLGFQKLFMINDFSC